MKPLSMEEFRRLQSGAAAALGTETVPLVIPGEAILGIEALARCTAGPGRRFVNLVTGPYGKDFGNWLRECGSEVTEVVTPWDEAVDPEEVRRVLGEVRPDVMSYVYTEAVTGGMNPAEELQKIAAEYGVLTLIDAVSSIGADPFRMDDWGVDFVSMGMQKALLGSNGISFLGISGRGMSWIRENPSAPRHSILSLPELADTQRTTVPPALSVLEARDALRAFAEAEACGGTEKLVERHSSLAAMVRRKVQEAGLELYQSREEFCTALNTTVKLPDTEAARNFGGAGIVAPGDWELRGQLLRINHYGEHCTEEDAEEALEILRGLM